MFQDRGMRKSVLASIIASIIVIILIQPILTLVFQLMNFLGTNVYTGFSNQIYRNAALGERSTMDLVLFAGLLLLINALCISVSALAFFAPSNGDESKQAAVMPVDKDNIKSNLPTETPPLKRSDRREKMSSVIVCVLLVIGSLVLLTLEFTNLQLNTSFRQRLTVLTPKLTDQEVKELKATWASMKSRGDFENLTIQMNELAKLHNVELPPPLPAGG